MNTITLAFANKNQADYGKASANGVIATVVEPNQNIKLIFSPFGTPIGKPLRMSIKKGAKIIIAVTYPSCYANCDFTFIDESGQLCSQFFGEGGKSAPSKFLAKTGILFLPDWY